MPLALVSMLLGLVLIVLGVTQANLWIKSRATPKPIQGRLTEDIRDPREAAAILLAYMAGGDSDEGSSQREMMRAMLQQRFDLSSEDADDLCDFGASVVKQVGDIPGSLRQILRPLREQCTLPEMKDIMAMTEQLASSPPTEEQRVFLSDVRAGLHLTAQTRL